MVSLSLSLFVVENLLILSFVLFNWFDESAVERFSVMQRPVTGPLKSLDRTKKTHKPAETFSASFLNLRRVGGFLLLPPLFFPLSFHYYYLLFFSCFVLQFFFCLQIVLYRLWSYSVGFLCVFSPVLLALEISCVGWPTNWRLSRWVWFVLRERLC